MLSIVEEIADAVAFIHQGQMLVYDSVSTLCQDGQSLESIFLHNFHNIWHTEK